MHRRISLIAVSTLAMLASLLGGGVVASPAQASTNLGTVTISGSGPYVFSPSALSAAAGDTFTFNNTTMDEFVLAGAITGWPSNLSPQDCSQGNGCLLLMNSSVDFRIDSPATPVTITMYIGGAFVTSFALNGAPTSTAPKDIYPTVTFDPNGGTCAADVNLSLTNDGSSNAQYTMPTAKQCTRPYSTLLGWTPGQEMTANPTAKYKPGTQANLTESLTLKAVWRTDSDEVIYDSNIAAADPCLKSNGENIPALIDRQSQLTLLNPGGKFAASATCGPATEPKKLAGWALTGNGPPIVAPGSDYSKSNLRSGQFSRLYAVWNNQPLLMLNDNGGSNLVTTSKPAVAADNGRFVAAGDKFSIDAQVLTPPEGSGDFVSWNTKADGSGTTYSADATTTYTMPAAGLTLYAHYERVKVTINYHANVGAADKCQTGEGKDLPVEFTWRFGPAGWVPYVTKDTRVATDVQALDSVPAATAVCRPPYAVLAGWSTSSADSIAKFFSADAPTTGTFYPLTQTLEKTNAQLATDKPLDLYAVWTLPRVTVHVDRVKTYGQTVHDGVAYVSTEVISWGSSLPTTEGFACSSSPVWAKPPNSDGKKELALVWFETLDTLGNQAPHTALMLGAWGADISSSVSAYMYQILVEDGGETLDEAKAELVEQVVALDRFQPGQLAEFNSLPQFEVPKGKFVTFVSDYVPYPLTSGATKGMAVYLRNCTGSEASLNVFTSSVPGGMGTIKFS